MLDAVAEGNVDPVDIRLAARHLLKPTIELGLLDGPTGPFRHLGPDDIDTPEYRQLAFEAGTEAITLLKNDKPAGASTPLLPLSKSGTVAVIGPAANFTQELLANYHGWNTVRIIVLLSLPRFCLITLLTHASWWICHNRDRWLTDIRRGWRCSRGWAVVWLHRNWAVSAA